MIGAHLLSPKTAPGLVGGAAAGGGGLQAQGEYRDDHDPRPRSGRNGSATLPRNKKLS